MSFSLRHVSCLTIAHKQPIISWTWNHVRQSFRCPLTWGGQVKTDPAKVKAVQGWPVPKPWRELPCFLGFANFYRHFIRNYSQVAAPFTRLTSSKIPSTWPWEAHTVFTKWKQLFASAPILIHPGTNKQFIVDVDASDVAVGAVLSHRYEPQGKRQLYLCHLTPTKQNYNVGDRELLEIIN